MLENTERNNTVQLESLLLCVCVCVCACMCVDETEIIACVYSEACHYTAASPNTRLDDSSLAVIFGHAGINSVSQKKTMC